MAPSRVKTAFQPSVRPVEPLMPQRVWLMPPLNMPVAEVSANLMAWGLTPTGKLGSKPKEWATVPTPTSRMP